MHLLGPECIPAWAGLGHWGCSQLPRTPQPAPLDKATTPPLLGAKSPVALE